MRFKTGNLLENVKTGIIAHCCNNIGLFNKGFAKQIRIKYPNVYTTFYSVPNRDLGEVNFARASNSLIIGNMISMNGVYREDNPHPLRLDFLEVCLQKVQSLSTHLDLPVHMPLIGSGLARGDWTTIRKIIERNCPSATVWELPTKKKKPKINISISDLFKEEEEI
jgi:hypothetical protein